VDKEALRKMLKLPTLGRRRRTRTPSQSTALVIEGHTMRVVQAMTSGNRNSITRVAAAALEMPAGADLTDPNVLGPAIARALARLQIKPGSVVMGVPRAQVVLRTLTLPVLDDIRELASMVHFQVGKDLPFRMDEAVVDFKVRRKLLPPAPRVEAEVKPDPSAPDTAPPPPKLEVLVAAVKRDVVDACEQTAAAAGLKLSALGLLPYANARCLDAFRLVEGEQAIALVSLRPEEMNIDVIAQQTLLFSRGAGVRLPHDPVPGAEGATSKPDTQAAEVAGGAAKSESYVEAVTIEVVRSLHGFSGMEPNRSVTRLAVTGATGYEAAAVEAIEKRMSRPCTLLDLASVLELPAEAREHAPGSIAGIGLALGLSDDAGLPFDFLNPKRPAVQRDMRRIRILATAAALVALGVFTMAVRSHLIQKHEKVRLQLVAEVADAEKKLPIYKKMIAQSKTVSDWSAGGHNWLEHYAYLSAILPPSEEIYITSLSVSGTGVIHLSVQARSGEVLAKLDKQLRAAGYDVKPVAITPGADRHGYEFRSSVELLIPAKMTIDLSKVKTPARLADDVSLDPAFNKGGGG
jgi:Tfp pilus assembly PilM family ATPase